MILVLSNLFYKKKLPLVATFNLMQTRTHCSSPQDFGHAKSVVCGGCSWVSRMVKPLKHFRKAVKPPLILAKTAIHFLLFVDTTMALLKP